MKFASFIILSICLGIALSKPIQDSTGQVVESSQRPAYCTGTFDFDCGESELRVRCISSLWMCDNVYDCTTGADEKCKHIHNCPTGYFICPNGDCISAKQRCDGIKDCLDGTDERACFINPMEPGKQNVQDPATFHSLADHDHHTFNHQAEAIVGDLDKSDGFSALTILFFCTLIIGLALLTTFWVLRRYPNAASRVDEALKEFRPRNALPNRLMQRSSPSRVNIISPGNANNDQFFDNPMNTIQQPLVLNVTAPVGHSATSSANMASLPNTAQ